MVPLHAPAQARRNKDGIYTPVELSECEAGDEDQCEIERGMIVELLRLGKVRVVVPNMVGVVPSLVGLVPRSRVVGWCLAWWGWYLAWWG